MEEQEGNRPGRQAWGEPDGQVPLSRTRSEETITAHAEGRGSDQDHRIEERESTPSPVNAHGVPRRSAAIGPRKAFFAEFYQVFFPAWAD
jgi:hypothetical protein